MGNPSERRERFQITLYPDVPEEREALKKVRVLKRRRRLREFIVNALRECESADCKASMSGEVSETLAQIKASFDGIEQRLAAMEQKIVSQIDEISQKIRSGHFAKGPEGMVAEDPDEETLRAEYIPVSDEEILEIANSLDLDILGMFPQD